MLRGDLMKFKLKWKVDGFVDGTVSVSLSVEEDKEVRNIGTLQMRVGEYQLIGAALSKGMRFLEPLVGISFEMDDSLFVDACNAAAESSNSGPWNTSADG